MASDTTTTDQARRKAVEDINATVDDLTANTQDDDSSVGDLLLRFIGLLTGILGSIQALGEPVATLAGYSAWQSTPVRLPDIDKLIAARFRGQITSDQFKTEMVRLGFNDRWSEILEASFSAAIPTAELAQLLWRGEIGEATFKNELGKQGFTSGDADKIIKLTELIPPVQDIISMAVRDVFTPSAVEQGKLFDQLPEQLLEWGQKQGLSEDWLRFYWGAHWRIPSAQMGFEMLHRGVIDDSELMTLLTALDIAPGWRERLTAISYRPLTRVDVRRMHAMGALTSDQVTQAYRDIGYDDDNAQLLTDFTELLTSNSRSAIPEELQGLTKSNILQFLRRGMIDDVDAVAMLTAMGVGDAAANGLVQHELIKQDLKLRDEQTESILLDVKAGNITFDNAQELFAELDPTEIEQAEFENDLDKAIAKADKLPTVEQVIKMFARKYLTENEAIDVMQRIGYSTFWARGILGLQRIKNG